MNRLRHRFLLRYHTMRARMARRPRRSSAKPGRSLAVILPRRARRRSPSKAAPYRWVLLAVSAVGVFLILNNYLIHHLRPVMTQMARVQADRLASRVVNEAIGKKIADGGVDYGRLIYLEKDVYGQVTALKTDVMAVNRLKANVIEEVLSALEQAGTAKLSIPAGNLINSDLFSGRGPGIPFKIVPLGTVSASFSNKFTSAGINQTRHEIMLDVIVDISVLLPGYSAGTQVSAQVTVAETVIIGAVPDSYFSIDDRFNIEDIK